MFRIERGSSPPTAATSILHVGELRRVRQASPPARRHGNVGHPRRAECEANEGSHRGESAGDGGRREPAPAAAELGRELREGLDVDAVERASAARQPAGEVREVGGVGAPGRLGEAGAVEEPIDRRAHVHPAGFAPCPLACLPDAINLLLRRAPRRRCGCCPARRPSHATGRAPRSPGHGHPSGDSLNVGVERYLGDSAAGLEDRRRRPGRTVDARRDCENRGRAPRSPPRRRQPRHERSARRTSRPFGPMSRGCWRSWPEPMRRLGDDLAGRSPERRLQRRSARCGLREPASPARRMGRHGRGTSGLARGDGLHGNETGYRERARAVAEAVKGCVPAQTVVER